MIRVAIVDDKQPNRVSLAEKIAFSADFSMSFQAANGQEFLDRMKAARKDEQPDIVLMDIDMPVMNGIDAVAAASALYPSTHFLMLTVFDDDEKIFDAIKAGAIGYLLKDEKVELIIDAIKQVIEIGGAPMSPRIARKALNMLMHAEVDQPRKVAEETQLSKREKEILKYLVDGYDYKDVGEKLFISPHTVRTHIANIYEKLHVCNKAQAIKVAMKNKWF
jgi:DNA-binding NarL/FixJ family response regulator